MGGSIVEITSENQFNSFRFAAEKAGKHVVVDFTAAWCGPCKAVAPHFERLSTQFSRLSFAKVDVDSLSEVAGQCQVRAMPTFQFYKGATKVNEVVGANLKELEALCAQYDAAGNLFQGTVRKLGDSNPASSEAAAPTASASAGGSFTGVDDSKPTTTLQLRLADGSQLRGTFNTSHTVGDIRRYLAAERPSLPPTCRLLSGFPQKPLTDNDATLEAAGLLNSVITVR